MGPAHRRNSRPAHQFKGAMDEIQRKFKTGSRCKHIVSGVVMDIATFKVSHSTGIDKDAAALRAARARSSSIGAMERYTWVRFAGKLTPCHTTHIATVSTPAGRWMKCHRRFKRRAHIASLIGVHVAVGQRCRAVDGESPTLPAKRTSA